MSRIMLGACAAVVCISSIASAANPPPKVAPVYVPPSYSWTGCYIGANAGGAWEKVQNTLTATNGAPAYFGAWEKVQNTLTATNGAPAYFGVAVLPDVSRNGTGSLDSGGFIGGGQVGCNYQSGRFVWGAETDFNWMHQHDHLGGRFVYSTDPTSPYFLDVSNDEKWLWTVRGRIGITATDRVLLYVTGGFAALRMDFRQTFSEPPFTTPPDGTPQVATFSKTKAGWTVGAGVEAGLWGNWTVKAEYFYAQFDGETVSGSFTGGVGVPRGATLANSLNDIHLQVARVGLNYRFVGP